MDDAKTTVLVAEHDDPTRLFLLDNLAADGFDAVGAQTGQETAVKLRNHNPALLVAGGLGAEHGPQQLVRAVRAGEVGSDQGLPVIVLGERGGDVELMRAFEAGGDDFIAKPFSYIELLARVRAGLRRAQSGPARRLAIGDLVVDRDTREAWHSGQKLWLSPLEFDLLVQLATEPQRVFTKPELLQSVWRFASQAPTRTVDTHASRLRRKLADAGARHLVHNTRGVGYRLAGIATPTPQPTAAPARQAVAA